MSTDLCVALNGYFLVERFHSPLPNVNYCRCRHGYFHVVNNDYTHWEMYAIGGSASPTINSQGNRFLAPNNRPAKEVTKHEDAPESEWRHWNWRSDGDLMLNGAYFRQSGAGASGI